MIKKIAIFARTLNKEEIPMEQNLTFADLGLSEEILQALEKKGYKFISADVAQVPSTTTVLTDPDQLVQMGKLLDFTGADVLFLYSVPVLNNSDTLK
mgnify:CR=1 FL=1